MMWLKAEFLIGTQIEDAIGEALAFAKTHRVAVQFLFNGIDVVVQPHENFARAMLNFHQSARHAS